MRHADALSALRGPSERPVGYNPDAPVRKAPTYLFRFDRPSAVNLSGRDGVRASLSGSSMALRQHTQGVGAYVPASTASNTIAFSGTVTARGRSSGFGKFAVLLVFTHFSPTGIHMLHGSQKIYIDSSTLVWNAPSGGSLGGSVPLPVGEPTALMLVLDGAPFPCGRTEVWRNGRLAHAQTGVGDGWNGVVETALLNDGFAQSLNGVMTAFALWDDYLPSQYEAREISRNPWLLFRYPDDEVVPKSAGAPPVGFTPFGTLPLLGVGA